MAPILTRIGNAFGFGASSGGASGPSALHVVLTGYTPAGDLVPTKNGITIPQTDLESTGPGSQGYEIWEPGYYTWEWKGGSAGTVKAWCWGGGGYAQGQGPGPGQGGAGGGVRGEMPFTPGETWTVLVGEGGKGPGSSFPQPGNPIQVGNQAFPDGGWATYNAGSGGGSSRIAKTEIPYANRNSAPNVYHLIGGGGGGGIGYTGSGTRDGRAGVPSGNPGGAWYSADGPGAQGNGGSQSSGGSQPQNGRKPAGAPGSKYTGGPGGTTAGGGGGGGGYYGGSGAGGYYAIGGGGSGYIHPSVSNSADFRGPSSYRYEAANDPSNPGALSYPGGSDKRSRGDINTIPSPGWPTWSTPSPNATKMPATTSYGNGLVRIQVQ